VARKLCWNLLISEKDCLPLIRKGIDLEMIFLMKNKLILLKYYKNASLLFLIQKSLILIIYQTKQKYKT